MLRKGQKKFPRIVQATAEILGSQSLSSLNIKDIARSAGISAPNFCLYFSSVLAAVQQVPMDNPAILQILEKRWPDSDLEILFRRFVLAYQENWRGKAALLRVRSVLVAECEPRFRDAERSTSGAVLLALTRQFSAPGVEVDEGVYTEATSAAGVTLAMLDRLASYLPRSHEELSGVDASLLTAATINMVLSIRHMRSGAALTPGR